MVDRPNGTEYALSALDFTGKLDNRIASWAFTNTPEPHDRHPDVRVTSTVIASEVYGQPPAVAAEGRALPAGQSLKDKLNLLDSNDDRMNQIVYSGASCGAASTRWSRPPTDRRPPASRTSWSTPSTLGDGHQAGVCRRQPQLGDVPLDRGDPPGEPKPTMVFTLAGPGFYPSTAYVSLVPARAP